MKILNDHKDGIRFSDLAEKLKVETSYLARLLRELEEAKLIIREKLSGKLTIVRLSFPGKIIVEEGEPPKVEEKYEATNRLELSANMFIDNLVDAAESPKGLLLSLN